MSPGKKESNLFCLWNNKNYFKMKWNDILFWEDITHKSVQIILTTALFKIISSRSQLDADDAEPTFDEKEGQDEYTEMHMPVWGRTSLI